MNKHVTTAAGALAVLMLAQSAQALTLVSTIDGAYDATGNTPGPNNNLATYTYNTDYGYDTPSLFISNTTAYSFTNVTLTATGYQGLNNGLSASVTLPTISAGETYQYAWTMGTAGTQGQSGNATTQMFAFDYDDQYQTTPGVGISALVGNFDVTFTATWNNPAYGPSGTPIFAQFSPDNTQGPGNAAGTFVGWEGLNPAGQSETSYDDHNGTPSGVLANIYVGEPSTVPEPGTLALLGVGLAGVAGMRRRRQSR